MLQLRLAFRRCAGLDSLPVARHTRLAISPVFRSTLRWYSTPPPPDDISEGEKEIYQKLTESFAPTSLRVQDISGGCGSFYAIIIASEAFRGLSTVKQHQLVNKALKSEIASIHGLQLKTVVPDATE